jgi:hypothetical protein
MKVALCLSGHFRNFELTHNSLINNIIKPLKADVFIHTWNKLGYHNNFRADSQHLINSQINIDKIKKYYNPKNIITEPENIIQTFIEESKIYAPHLINEPKSPGHMASMYYKIMMCNRLRKEYEEKNKIKYDCVIRCRPDLLFEQSLNISNLDKINIPTINSFTGLNDQFAYSSGQNMDVYSDLFQSIPTYFKLKKDFYPEKMLKWYLNITGISVSPININYKLLR